MVGTFGRGAYILDDYSALRELSDSVMAEEARLLPLRDASLFEELGQQAAAWGNVTTPNPPVGATITYTVGRPPEGDTKLLLTIADDAGKPVRRMEVPKTIGVNRPPGTAGDRPVKARRRPRRPASRHLVAKGRTGAWEAAGDTVTPIETRRLGRALEKER